ncbi:MAG TPA: DUF6266 family protein [Puia sp.]|jgi:hypothetical protein|nr:DUF6266 family protein [Puia sp.]
MAKLLNGINGPFSGKVGAVVGYVLNGQAVIRGLPGKKNWKSSVAQKQQQAKFALMHDFLRTILPFLNITYDGVAVQMTGFNKAFSYNVKNAISGTYPDLQIDYTRVQVGSGDLPNAQSPAAIVSSDGHITFSWTYDRTVASASPTDQAFVAIYCEEKKMWNCELNPASRKAGICLIDATSFSGKKVHTYIGFISNDGKTASDSLYTGSLQL